MRLLHITAHLGGGVGKVLSRLAEESSRRSDGIRHVVACLEAPEKSAFADHLSEHGAELLICPGNQELAQQISRADIVQLEWWHHPVMAGWMCSGQLPPMRLVVWSHVSGLYLPELRPDFVAIPHRFLFTSPCSLLHPSLSALDDRARSRADFVFSSGGFDGLPAPPERKYEGALRVGYLGTLNFAKLHPRLLDFVDAVGLPDFRMVLVGDPTTGAELMDQATRRGLDGRVELRGYREDVVPELAGFDVLAYILNPLHYGTTENALLEAMAMGVVPVVLDNPAERHLVENGENGLVVSNPKEFADALAWLHAHPEECRRLSAAASRKVRGMFSIGITSERLARHYWDLMTESKRLYDFRPIFGDTPADWFRSCQGQEAWRFRDDGGVDLQGEPPHVLFERTKGSVFHYHRTFRADPRLASWAKGMAAWN